MPTQIKPSQIVGYTTTDYVSTYAEAVTLASTLQDGALIIVANDETNDGAQARYVVDAGAPTSPSILTASQVRTLSGASVEDALATAGAVKVEQLLDVSGPPTANKQILEYDLTNELWVPTTKRFDIMASQFGTLDANAIVFNLRPGVAVQLPENLSGSTAYSEVAATGSTVFSLKKNGVQVGMITFTPGSTTGTLSTGPAVDFLAEDKITLVAPATADTTLASVAFRIRLFEV